MKNNSDYKKFDIIYKIVITGNINAGKTSLFNYYTGNNSKKNSSSIAPLLGKKYISLDDKIILIHIWDTCGMEHFGHIVDIFYKDAKGAFVVYDITDRQSFNSVGKWIDKLSDSNPIITILGNKCDLTNRTISKDDGKKTAEKYKAYFFETSCLNKTNLDQALDNLVRSIYSKYKDDNDDNDFIIYKDNSFEIENKNFMISNIKTNSEARKADYELCY